MTLDILKQQRIQLAETLKVCQTSRKAVLSEERRCVDEIACDRLAIEIMVEFNAKSIRSIEPERTSDRRSFRNRISVPERSLKLLDKPVEEWRQYLAGEQLSRCKMQGRMEEDMESSSSLQRKRRAFFEKLSQLRDERTKRHAKFVEAHEEFLANEVEKQMALNRLQCRDQLNCFHEKPFCSIP